jgi:pilus assembly protein CpaE
MECWIIGDSLDEVTRVRTSLQHLNLDCPAAHVLSFDDALRTLQCSETATGTAFVSMPAVGYGEVELIRRLRSASKVRLVVVSSTADNASIVNAIRAGVSDYLDIEGDLDSEVSSCLSRIKQAESELRTKSFTISIVPCHVASDGSVLATNLAASIAKKCGSCCLLDFQLRGGDLAILLKLTPAHSIYDLITQPQSVDAVMFQQALAAHESGIHLLAGPPLFSDLRGIDPQTCNGIIDHAQNGFPYVIVATEDIQHSEQIYALSHSDRIVLTMRPDLLSVHRAKQHVDFMLSHGINDDQIQVAVLGSGVRGELPIAGVKKVLNRATVHSIPDDATAVTLSINVGNPVMLESPHSVASRGISKLLDALLGQSLNEPVGTPRGRFATKAAALLALNTLPFCS